MLKRLFKGLKKTRDNLATGMRRLFGREQLDADTIDEMEELLYTADLGPAASQLTEEVRAANRAPNEDLDARHVEIVVQDHGTGIPAAEPSRKAE